MGAREGDIQLMCTPAEALKIRTEVGSWMQRGKMFTSVDIANSLKQRGDWIRNRTVADYLRQNVVNFAPQYGCKYTKSVIDVQLPNGSYTEATLYHPEGSSPSAYTRTAQKALSPDEAKNDSPTKGVGVVADASGVRLFATPQDADQSEDSDSCCHSHSLLEGLETATLKEFEPRPYQIINITIGQVGTLVIGGSHELPDTSLSSDEVIDEED
jgi:hypothetical protein